MSAWEIREGDVLDRLREMPTGSVQCAVTSPPYWGLRDYGQDGQLGLEATLEEYVANMVEVFREVKRVLRDDGTLWLNLGDSYTSVGSGGDTKTGFNNRYFGRDNDVGKQGDAAGLVKKRQLRHGLKPKDLVGIPWRVAFALQEDGWYLRSDIIWHKPNPMPESVTDRPTKAHEYVFLLTKSARYFYDNVAVMEQAKYGKEHANKTTSWGSDRKHPNKANVADYAFKGDNHTTSKMPDGSHGRNKRTVWKITTKPYAGVHFATFPPELPELCIKAGSQKGGTVLDPFSGAGTTGMVALRLGRSYIGIELNPEYAEMSRKRIDSDCPLFNRHE